MSAIFALQTHLVTIILYLCLTAWSCGHFVGNFLTSPLLWFSSLIWNHLHCYMVIKFKSHPKLHTGQKHNVVGELRFNWTCFIWYSNFAIIWFPFYTISITIGSFHLVLFKKVSTLFLNFFSMPDFSLISLQCCWFCFYLCSKRYWQTESCQSKSKSKADELVLIPIAMSNHPHPPLPPGNF